jgi:hypothetical protein
MTSTTTRLISIGVMVIFLIGVLAYYKTHPKTVSTAGTAIEETSDQTASWKIYTNSDYGFSLAYPDTWRLVDNLTVKNGGTLQFFNYPADKYIGGEVMESEDIKIEAVVLDKPQDLTLQRFMEQSAQSGLGSLKEHIYGKIQLKEVEALTDEVKDDTSYKSYYVELANNKVLLLTSSPNTLDVQAVLIISSLQVEK